MSPLARLRGGPRHGQTVEIARPAFCVLLPEHDGEAVYELCASGDFGEFIYRYSHTDRGEPLDEPGGYDDAMQSPNGGWWVMACQTVALTGLPRP